MCTSLPAADGAAAAAAASAAALEAGDEGGAPPQPPPAPAAARTKSPRPGPSAGSLLARWPAAAAGSAAAAAAADVERKALAAAAARTRSPRGRPSAASPQPQLLLGTLRANSMLAPGLAVENGRGGKGRGALHRAGRKDAQDPVGVSSRQLGVEVGVVGMKWPSALNTVPLAIEPQRVLRSCCLCCCGPPVELGRACAPAALSCSVHCCIGLVGRAGALFSPSLRRTNRAAPPRS